MRATSGDHPPAGCDDGRVTPRPVRFRHHAAVSVAAVVAMIGALPVVTAGGPAWIPLLLLPLAVAVWAWRAGTDADTDGLVVHALLGSRRIPWSRVEALVPDGARRVRADLTGGGAVALPAVTPADLPRLVAASGQAVSGTGDAQ